MSSAALKFWERIMSKLGTATIAAAFLLSACSGQMAAEKAKAPANMAHAHMGHVTTSWKDTPDKMGLLPTAMAEAKIAKQHAGLALQQPANLAWLKTHTVHVVNAVDPSVEAKGPGLGYGVMKAAAGAAQHIGFAADSEGASANVKAHAEHVATSTGNAVDWAKQIVALGDRVKASTSAADAAVMVRLIDGLATQLVDGTDANKDGKVTWVKGEGGLGQAELHMGFMSKGEGLTK
jgi:hypothetical protein